MTHNSDYSSVTSSTFGFVSSVAGSFWMGLVQDSAKAFILGVVGAFAGWLFNYVRVKITKK